MKTNDSKIEQAKLQGYIEGLERGYDLADVSPMFVFGFYLLGFFAGVVTTALAFYSL